MRKCLRCHEEMVENLDVKVDMQGYGIRITTKGVFGTTVEKLKLQFVQNVAKFPYILKILNQ